MSEDESSSEEQDDEVLSDQEDTEHEAESVSVADPDEDKAAETVAADSAEVEDGGREAHSDPEVRSIVALNGSAGKISLYTTTTAVFYVYTAVSRLL